MHYKYSLSQASNWFVTLYCKLLPSVSSSSKHGHHQSSLLLYSTFNSLWELCYYSAYDLKMAVMSMWSSGRCACLHVCSKWVIKIIDFSCACVSFIYCKLSVISNMLVTMCQKLSHTLACRYRPCLFKNACCGTMALLKIYRCTGGVFFYT